MDGEDADAAIWITVRPGMGDGGIIDWQKLKNFLTGRCHEINHCLEITEIAHSGTLLAAQGEYRHLLTFLLGEKDVLPQAPFNHPPGG